MTKKSRSILPQHRWALKLWLLRHGRDDQPAAVHVPEPGRSEAKARKLKIKDAMKLLIEEEAAKLVNPEELKQDVIDAVEQHGSCLSTKSTKSVSAASLPDRMFLVKAFSVTAAAGRRLHCFHQTRDGQTDHILFIASGAFQIAKPSDLIPEL